MLSHKLVFSESKNFTSGRWILAPPTIPINHYLNPKNQQNRISSPKLLFHANVFIARACFEHSNFFKVKDLDHESRPVKGKKRFLEGWQTKTGAQSHKDLGQFCQARNPTTSFLTATTLIYATGAGITAAAGTRLALQLIIVKGFKLDSFQLPD